MPVRTVEMSRTKRLALRVQSRQRLVHMAHVHATRSSKLEQMNAPRLIVSHEKSLMFDAVLALLDWDEAMKTRPQKSIHKKGGH